MFNN
jgi:hypothetical protein